MKTVGVKLTADITGYVSGLQRAKAATVDFKGQIEKASQAGNLDKVTDRAAVLGAGLVGVAASAVKMAADFDKSMSAVAAATHAPAGEIAQLRAAALQAGKDTQYSATQAADGITELSKAGVSTADVLNGGLKGALNLAAAGQLSVGEAAETAASAMTQFKLSGSAVPHVADLLAAAAGKAQGSVHDMGYALSQSGLVAAQFGLSIEDTTGVLAEFASAGLLGSDAGTSLKTMLLALANPSSQTKDKMNELGISFYDATGKFIGLSGVAQVLQSKLKGLTDEQRQQALGQIFGNDAIRAASVLYSDGAAGVEKWKNAVNDSGYAAETAQKQTDNLAGDIERLKGSLETLAIQSGSGANSGLRVLTKSINGVVNSLLSLPGPVTSAVTILAGLSGGALILGAGWLKLRKTSADVRAELSALGPAGEKAAGGMSKLSGAAGKVSLVFAALQAAGAVIGQFQKDLNPQVEALGVGLQQYAQSGHLAGEASRVLGNNLDDLKVGFAFLADGDNSRRQATKHLQEGLESIIPGLKGTNTSLATTQTRVDAMDTALAQLVSSGNTAAANQAFQKLATELAVGGVSMDEFRKQFPQYAAALQVAGAATKGATNQTGDLNSALAAGADSQDKYATAAQSAAGAARGERAALSALSDQMKKESDPVFALLSAEKDLTKARKDATSATKKYGDNSTQASTATQKLAQAAIALQGAAGDLGDNFNGKLSPAFRTTLKAAGLTSGQIKDVQKQFTEAKKDADKYTGNYAAKVSAPGAKDAKKQLDDAYTSANHFAGPYSADLRVTGQSKVEAEFHKLSLAQQALKSGKTIQGFAEGGHTGPGSKYQVAGVVHADEFVINKDSRQNIERKAPGLLDHMNTTGSVPGYADGGTVMPYPVDASRTKVGTLAQALGSTYAGGGNLGAWIMAAIGLTHVGANWAGPLHTLVMRESGGNPRSVNLWDSNAKAGHPSAGLAQTIPSTFEHYRLKSLPDDIFNPVANLAAAIRYIESRYGSIFHVQQANASLPPKGYANGGAITEPISGIGASGRRYTFGEVGPEWVTPGGRPVAGGMWGGGNTVVMEAHFHGPIGSRVELESWFTATYDKLKQRGKVG